LHSTIIRNAEVLYTEYGCHSTYTTEYYVVNTKQLPYITTVGITFSKNVLCYCKPLTVLFLCSIILLKLRKKTTILHFTQQKSAEDWKIILC